MTTLLANPADGFPSAGFKNLLVPDTTVVNSSIPPQKTYPALLDQTPHYMSSPSPNPLSLIN